MKFGDELIAQLDELGEPEVRRRMTRGEYGSKVIRYDAVQEWLRAQERLREEAHNASQAAAAERAALAAERAAGAADRQAAAAEAAAREARMANQNAKIARIIAIIAIIVSIIGFFVS